MTSNTRLSLLALLDADADEHIIFQWAVKDLGVPVECQYFLDCSQFAQAIITGHCQVPDFIFIGCGIPTATTARQLAELRSMPELAQTNLLIYTGLSAQHLFADLLSQFKCKLFVKCSSVGELAKQLALLVDDRLPAALTASGDSLMSNLGAQA